jgi:hypothetical protein
MVLINSFPDKMNKHCSGHLRQDLRGKGGIKAWGAGQVGKVTVDCSLGLQLKFYYKIPGKYGIHKTKIVLISYAPLSSIQL